MMDANTRSSIEKSLQKKSSKKHPFFISDYENHLRLFRDQTSRGRRRIYPDPEGVQGVTRKFRKISFASFEQASNHASRTIGREGN